MSAPTSISTLIENFFTTLSVRIADRDNLLEKKDCGAIYKYYHRMTCSRARNHEGDHLTRIENGNPLESWPQNTLPSYQN